MGGAGCEDWVPAVHRGWHVPGGRSAQAVLPLCCQFVFHWSVMFKCHTGVSSIKHCQKFWRNSSVSLLVGAGGRIRSLLQLKRLVAVSALAVGSWTWI